MRPSLGWTTLLEVPFSTTAEMCRDRLLDRTGRQRGGEKRSRSHQGKSWFHTRRCRSTLEEPVPGGGAPLKPPKDWSGRPRTYTAGDIARDSCHAGWVRRFSRQVLRGGNLLYVGAWTSESSGHIRERLRCTSFNEMTRRALAAHAVGTPAFPILRRRSVAEAFARLPTWPDWHIKWRLQEDRRTRSDRGSTCRGRRGHGKQMPWKKVRSHTKSGWVGPVHMRRPKEGRLRHHARASAAAGNSLHK